MLEVEKVGVSLGGMVVLDGVSLAAGAGEFIALLGPNGAGKTTLLRTLAGLLSFDGQIRLAGQDVGRMEGRARARAIAYLPQASAVHWPLAGRDVVAIGRLPYSSSLTALSAVDHAAIETALLLADARAFADRPVTELSGGERARILLARALAVESNVLLADEPLAALDPAHQLDTLAILAGLAGRGRLVIAALHDLGLAARFASRVVVMQGGRIAGDGTSAEVLTGELISKVFGIETVILAHQGVSMPVPWQTVAGGRDN